MHLIASNSGIYKTRQHHFQMLSSSDFISPSVDDEHRYNENDEVSRDDHRRNELAAQIE